MLPRSGCGVATFLFREAKMNGYLKILEVSKNGKLKREESILYV